MARQDLDSIRRRIFSESMEKEAIVRQTLGENNFHALENFAFEYACRIAESLGFPYKIIAPESKEYDAGANYQFRQMCIQHRRWVVDEVYESIRSSKDRIDSSQEIKMPSQKDIAEMVRRDVEEGKKIELIVHDYALCYVSRPHNKSADSS